MVTTEERLPNKEQPGKTRTIGPWVSFLVTKGVTAASRVQMPDGGFLSVQVLPKLAKDRRPQLENCRRDWRDIDVSHWLAHFEEHMSLQPDARMRGGVSSWGMILKDSVPPGRDTGTEGMLAVGECRYEVGPNGYRGRITLWLEMRLGTNRAALQVDFGP